MPTDKIECNYVSKKKAWQYMDVCEDTLSSHDNLCLVSYLGLSGEKLHLRVTKRGAYDLGKALVEASGLDVKNV